MTDCKIIGMLPPAPGPKEKIKRYLNEQKAKRGNASISEKELIDAIDKLGPADKETEDLLYALSDICPHESVRQKAADALKK